MDLSTKIVTEDRVEAVCNPTFPMMIADVHGTWWRIGAKVEAVDAPPVWMKVSFASFHPNDLGLNVYTAAELADWRDVQLFPNRAKQLEQTLVRGTCRQDHGCQLRTFPNQPALSLERLVNEGLDAVEDAVTPAWWTNIEEMVQYLAPAGTLGGCAVLVYAAARVIHLGGQRLLPGGLR